MRIRKATLHDGPAIHALVTDYARRGEVLPRTLSEIYETIRAWMVAEEEGRIIGCGALVILDADLAEVRSLAVAPAYQGNGIGRKIVEALIEEGKALGVTTIFALTRAVPFFERLGFAVTEKERFPRKIWRDCLKCPLFPHCDETAVVRAVKRYE